MNFHDKWLYVKFMTKIDKLYVLTEYRSNRKFIDFGLGISMIPHCFNDLSGKVLQLFITDFRYTEYQLKIKMYCYGQCH